MNKNNLLNDNWNSDNAASKSESKAEMKDEQIPYEKGTVMDDFSTNESQYKEEHSERADASEMSRYLNTEVGSTGAYEEYMATVEFPKKRTIQDDGQKVANMNVEGMPWFHDEVEEQELRARLEVPELNGRETRRLIFSSMLAALVIAGIFILALFLFLLFCTNVWF